MFYPVAGRVVWNIPAAVCRLILCENMPENVQIQKKLQLHHVGEAKIPEAIAVNFVLL
jgi:hypothetical protein